TVLPVPAVSKVTPLPSTAEPLAVKVLLPVRLIVPMPVMVPADCVPAPVRISVWLLRVSVLLPVAFISRPAMVGSTSRVGWLMAPATLRPTVLAEVGVLPVQLPPSDQLMLLPPLQLSYGGNWTGSTP